MSTTFYFPASTAAPVAPTVQGAWTGTTGFLRRYLANVKGSDTVTAGSTITYAGTGANTGALDRMYVSDPLQAQTIAAGISIDMQLMGRQFAADNVDTGLLHIWVCSNDGSTVRGTIASYAGYGTVGNAWINNATQRNVTFATAAGTTPFTTSVVCQAGDRIVVEIGSENSIVGTSLSAAMKWGMAGTVLPVNDTQTTDGPGWITFGQTLLFQPLGVAVVGSPPVSFAGLPPQSGLFNGGAGVVGLSTTRGAGLPTALAYLRQASIAPPVVTAPTPQIKNGKSGGYPGPTSTGFGLPTALATLLTVVAPSPTALPPTPRIENGKSGGYLGQSTTGFGNVTPLWAQTSAAPWQSVFGLPPPVGLFNGQAGVVDNSPGATTRGAGNVTPLWSQTAAAAAPYVALPPLDAIALGVVPAAVPLPATLTQAAPAALAALPPLDVLTVGFGSPPAPITFVQPVVLPPSAQLPPLDTINRGAGFPTPLWTLTQPTLSAPSAQLPPLGSTTIGFGLPPAPITFAQPFVLPPLATLPPVDTINAWFGFPTALASVLISTPPVLPAAPVDAIYAGVVPVVAPGVASLTVGTPAPSAQLPPLDVLTRGFGFPPAPITFVAPVVLPPLAGLPPPATLTVGFGFPTALPSLTQGTTVPFVALPPAVDINAGFGSPPPPITFSQAVPAALVGLPPVDAIFAGVAPPPPVGAGVVLVTALPPVAALPPLDVVARGFGFPPAPITQTVAQLAPSAQLPPATDINAGFGQPTALATLVLGLPPPALAALPPIDTVNAGAGTPTALATLTRARVVDFAVLPPLDAISSGAGFPTAIWSLTQGLPPPALAPLPPPTAIAAGFGLPPPPAPLAPFSARLPVQAALPPLAVALQSASPTGAGSLTRAVVVPPFAGLPILAVLTRGFGLPSALWSQTRAPLPLPPLPELPPPGTRFYGQLGTRTIILTATCSPGTIAVVTECKGAIVEATLSAATLAVATSSFGSVALVTDSTGTIAIVTLDRAIIDGCTD